MIVTEHYMRIDAPEGTKVAYLNKEAGYPYDQEEARRHLTLEGIYTVERTVIHNFTTDVYLKELPGLFFNSVLFSEIEESNA